MSANPDRLSPGTSASRPSTSVRLPARCLRPRWSGWLARGGGRHFAARLLLAVVVLAGALPVASGTPTVGAAGSKSGFEAFYNPFGDPWSTKASEASSIPVALTPPCNRIGPAASLPTPNEDELAFLARSNGFIMWEECAELADISDGIGRPRIKQFAEALRARNPNLRYLGYLAPEIASTGSLASAPPYPVALPYIAAHHEDWFVHRDGAPPDAAHRLKSNAGSPRHDLYDLTNPALRDYLAQAIADSIAFHGLQGVILDGCLDQPNMDQTLPGNVPPSIVLQSWEDSCVALLDKIKQAVGASRLVMFTGFAHLGSAGQPNNVEAAFRFYQRRVRATDGFVWEDPLGKVYSNDLVNIEFNVNRLNRVLDDAASVDKFMVTAINTNLQPGASFENTTEAQQRQFARYYFAAHLNFFRDFRTPLMHYTPILGNPQFYSSTFFRDWDLNVGNPRGMSQEVMPGVYRRDFERGIAILNAGTGPYTLSLPPNVYSTPEGDPVTTNSVPTGSGMIFVASEMSFACTERSRVKVQTTRTGPGVLHVTVEAGVAPLRELQVGTTRPIQNGVVEVEGQPARSSAFNVTFPTGIASTHFTVRRRNPGPVTVPFVVKDACGEWPSFVGVGTDG
ncbi:MAG: hypothetical protein IT305_00835 [Chloroflexi bacterium]|nr:hypothetical protein [Chloroflexota bacterium]